MFQRTLLVLALALLPLGALADTASGSTASSQLSQPGAASTDLGPASGGSTSDGTSLQPAGTSPLQSTTSDSNGLTAPDSNTLQEPASANSGNLQVLLGDNADGGQQPLPSPGINYWYWLIIAVLLGLIAAGVSVFVRARNQEVKLASVGRIIPELPATNYESGLAADPDELKDNALSTESALDPVPENPSVDEPDAKEVGSAPPAPDTPAEDKPVGAESLHHASHPNKSKKKKHRRHK